MGSQIWISSRDQFCVKASHLFVTLFTSLGNIVIIFIHLTEHYMKLYALRASPVHPFMFHGLPEIVLDRVSKDMEWCGALINR